MDANTRLLLDRLERRIEESSEEAAAAVAADVQAFGPIRDPALPGELLKLARHQWVTFIATVRTGRPPTADQLRLVRDRAATIATAAPGHGEAVS